MISRRTAGTAFHFKFAWVGTAVQSGLGLRDLTQGTLQVQISESFKHFDAKYGIRTDSE